jgi:pimeloyl-ACP methyl ester carboxylesterase
VLIPERRGYGGSGGVPYSQFRGNDQALMRRLQAEARDVLAITDAVLAASTRIDRNRVVGVGHSLGGAITLFAAGERPELFRGVVTQSAGWAIHDPTRPLYMLMIDAMTRGAKAFPWPILFQHHPQDLVVPVIYSRTVYERLIEAGRNNVFFHEPAVPTHELPLREGRPEGHLIFGMRATGGTFLPSLGSRVSPAR